MEHEITPGWAAQYTNKITAQKAHPGSLVSRAVFGAHFLIKRERAPRYERCPK